MQAKLDAGDLSSELPAENLDEAARLVGPGRHACRVTPGWSRTRVCRPGE